MTPRSGFHLIDAFPTRAHPWRPVRSPEEAEEKPRGSCEVKVPPPADDPDAVPCLSCDPVADPQAERGQGEAEQDQQPDGEAEGSKGIQRAEVAKQRFVFKLEEDARNIVKCVGLLNIVVAVVVVVVADVGLVGLVGAADLCTTLTNAYRSENKERESQTPQTNHTLWRQLRD